MVLTFSALSVDYKFGAKLFSGSNYQAYSSGLHKNTLVGRTAEAPNQLYVFPGIDEATGQPNQVAVSAQNYYGKICENNIAEEFTYNASFIKLREVSLSYTFRKANGTANPLTAFRYRAKPLASSASAVSAAVLPNVCRLWK